MFDGHGFGGDFMWLLWVLSIVAIAWIAKMVVAGDGENKEEPRSPLEILEERFARGELEGLEFEHKRKLLGG